VRDVALRDLLAAQLPFPIAVYQDGRAAALAEKRASAAAGQGDVAVIALGTGIAAGFIANGSIIGGASSRAGELGHVPVIPGGETCACGMTGCAEAYAAGRR